MRRRKKTAFLFFLFVLLTVSGVVRTGGREKEHPLRSTMEIYKDWENPRVCSGCHWDKFSDWSRSQMGRSYTGDFFQAQFFELALPSGLDDPDVKETHEGCIGCHSPSAFLAGEMIPPRVAHPDNYWDQGSGNRYMAERGVFCDFCHTVEGYDGDMRGKDPFNHNYRSAATPKVDPKRADLEFPWSPHHGTQLSELHETAEFCGICHNEQNSFGVWVKTTHFEYLEGPYPGKNMICVDCHMPHRSGKPAKMGAIRPKNTEHWFSGGFSSFVEGAAKVSLRLENYDLRAGDPIEFEVEVYDVATGHKFPTGSSEEQDVWLHVGVYDEEGEELDHIKIPPNPNDPHDTYFITSNEKTAYASHSKRSEPIARDALVEGDRLYHSVFLDSEENVTYAQWYAVEEVENRFEPLEKRLEHYTWAIPAHLAGETVILRAVLYYRRMADSHADYLGIERRPTLEVGRDEVRLRIE